MSRYIEYYEVKTQTGYEYYFMPLDFDAKNKENLDSRSHRIWKVDTKTNRFEEILNRKKDSKPVTKLELFTIQLSAKPVPYSEYYLRLEEVRQLREQHQAEKSSTVDQVQDT